MDVASVRLMDVFVDEPVSPKSRMDDGKVGYLVKLFLTIDKEDWEQNQSPPGISENSENLPLSQSPQTSGKQASKVL